MVWYDAESVHRLILKAAGRETLLCWRGQHRLPPTRGCYHRVDARLDGFGQVLPGGGELGQIRRHFGCIYGFFAGALQG